MGTTDTTPADNGGGITFTYPIEYTSYSLPVLSDTIGEISGNNTDEGAHITSVGRKSCTIVSDWYKAMHQTYRLIIIGR